MKKRATDVSPAKAYVRAQASEKNVKTALLGVQRPPASELESGTREMDVSRAGGSVPPPAVEEQIPALELLIELAELFKLFADVSRVRILHTLLNSEQCVNDIGKCIHMGQSAVSHQLRLLKLNKLVKCRRCGKTIYYAVADDHVKTLLHYGLEHIKQ